MKQQLVLAISVALVLTTQPAQAQKETSPKSPIAEIEQPLTQAKWLSKRSHHPK